MSSSRITALLVASLLALGGCTDDPAVYQLPDPYSWHELVPEGRPINAARAFAGGVVVATGAEGLLSIHDGVQWSDLTTPTDADLVAVWGTHPDTVWAVGPAATIVARRGDDVAIEPTSTLGDLLDVDGLPDGRVWAVGRTGRLLERDDGAWVRHYVGNIGIDFVRLEPTADGSVFIVDGTGGMHFWDGAERVPLPAPGIGQVRDVLEFEGDIWAAGDGGVAIRVGDVWVVDSGAPTLGRRLFANDDALHLLGDGVWRRGPDAWTEVAVPGGSDLVDVVGDPDGGLTAIQTDGAVERRIDDVWVTVAAPSFSPIRDIAGHDDTWYVVGARGLLLHWDGTMLHDRSIDPATGLRRVWASPGDTVMCVGDAGMAMLSIDGVWTETETGTDADLHDVWGRSGDDIYAAGDGPTLLWWTQGAWHPMTPPSGAADLRFVRMTPDGMFRLMDADDRMWYPDPDEPGTWTIAPYLWESLGDVSSLYMGGPDYFVLGGEGGLGATNFEIWDEASGGITGVLDIVPEDDQGPYVVVGRNGLHAADVYRAWSHKTVPWSGSDYTAVHRTQRSTTILGTSGGGLARYGR